MQVGDKLPDLKLAASGGRTVALRAYQKPLVIYFYPKDNTPGCTQEGQDFRDLHEQFIAAGAEVLGVSRDSVKSHDNFIAKHGFPFTLLSDADGVMCQAFGTLKEKSLYGRRYMGVERSTFLFDAKGILKREWRGVKVKNHAAEVLAALREI
jgi:peroxiredoxin Q/BCP